MKLKGQKLKREVDFVCQLGENAKWERRKKGKGGRGEGVEELLQLEKGIRSATILKEGGHQGGIFCFFQSFEELY